MNELYDKLIIRIIFALIICFIIYIYKQAHLILFPSIKHQILKKFSPSKNSTDTIHLFGRIIGIGIIYSNIVINVSDGMYFALGQLFLESIMVIALYLASLYILESIVLYNFEYADEILRRKNYAYAIICFSHSISLAYILKTVIKVSNSSLIMTLFLWLFAVVLIGFCSKTFQIISKLSFNRLLVQKSLAVAISYMGFILGLCTIISSSLDHSLQDIKWYTIQVILKILLSIIIIPIIRKGLILVFSIQDDLQIKKDDTDDANLSVELGYGIYEGAILFTSCFLTTVITGNIYYGNFYPLF
ncbi:hypothetical protein ABMA79_06570 [Halobacteriovorax sp. HFRX-2_2]|uniref:DUF350 domain-containing protein n=1 Tax=unclassified Halobacteriovorax TaxID=2639665 RepID=UPI003716F6E8